VRDADPAEGDADLVVAEGDNPLAGADVDDDADVGGGSDTLLRLGPGTFISIYNPVASNLKSIGLISSNT
jgi:hypothetical protein